MPLVGSHWTWEPRNPKAFERVTVTAVNVNADSEVWVETVNERGVKTWNDIERFLEASVVDD
jgi:hypothetical protein